MASKAMVCTLDTMYFSHWLSMRQVSKVWIAYHTALAYLGIGPAIWKSSRRLILPNGVHVGMPLSMLTLAASSTRMEIFAHGARR